MKAFQTFVKISPFGQSPGTTFERVFTGNNGMSHFTLVALGALVESPEGEDDVGLHRRGEGRYAQGPGERELDIQIITRVPLLIFCSVLSRICRPGFVQ